VFSIMYTLSLTYSNAPQKLTNNYGDNSTFNESFQICFWQ
jgi:hypothetical protein